MYKRQATLEKYPGPTIDRAETDVDGATYEAHITTADGQHLTVLLDADMNITGTEQGRGGGGNCGGGGGGRRGAPTDDAPADDTTGS